MRTRYTRPSILLGASRVCVYREACFAFGGPRSSLGCLPSCVQLSRFIQSIHSVSRVTSLMCVLPPRIPLAALVCEPGVMPDVRGQVMCAQGVGIVASRSG